MHQTQHFFSQTGGMASRQYNKKPVERFPPRMRNLHVTGAPSAFLDKYLKHFSQHDSCLNCFATDERAMVKPAGWNSTNMTQWNVSQQSMHPANACCRHMSGLGSTVAPVQILLDLSCHGLHNFLPPRVKRCLFGAVPLGATTPSLDIWVQ